MAHRDADLSRFVPLSVKDFHILYAFSDGPAHGYAVVKAVEERTDGLVRLEPANLYRRIHGFVEDGLLQETDAPPGEDEDRRRRYYALSGLGREVLAHEVARWRSLVAEAARRGLAG